MKRSLQKLMFCTLFLLAQTVAPVLADPLLDPIVGYWVSSSGTPLTISYSGQPNVAWLSINGGPSINMNVQDRFGTIIFGYTSPDGTSMSGMYDAATDTISVNNAPERTFQATWRRRN